MSGLESDTIGGYNAMLEKQQKEPGEAVITTVLFDDQYELLHDRINLRGVAPVTDKEYFVRGNTALLDDMYSYFISETENKRVPDTIKFHYVHIEDEGLRQRLMEARKTASAEMRHPK